MNTPTYISKHEFVQHTSRYLKLCQKEGMVIITHHNQPTLCLSPIKQKTIFDMQGLLKGMKIEGDINEPVFPEFDKW